MSLDLALNTALTGLRASQAALAVVSHNIANANNEDHSRQVVNQSALVLDNVGSGVRIDTIDRKIDEYIARSVRNELSTTGRVEARSNYMERVQLLLGEPGADNSLNAFTDRFFNSLQDLSQNPERSSLRQATLKGAESLTLHVNNVAKGLEDLRFEADQDVNRAINEVNNSINELYDLNIAINTAAARNQSTASLKDQRDAALKRVADIMDINVRFYGAGQVNVSTAGGFNLLDDQRYRLEYTPASSANTFISDTTLGAINLRAIDSTGTPATVAQELVAPGVEGSVTTPLRGGKLLGLLQMRDIELPAILSSIDQYATTLTDSFNAIHNKGGGYPPASELTGTFFTDPGEIRQWTNLANIAVLDANGQPLTNPYDTTPPGNTEVGGLRPLPLDFSFNSGELDVGQHSTQTIIDEINAYYGNQQNKVHINNLNDIRLVVREENNPAGGTLSFDFNMENISTDTAQVEILGVVPSVGAIGTPPPAGAINIIAGEYGRTGTDMSFDVNGVAGAVFNLDVQVQVTNANTGAVVLTTVRYTVDANATDIKNNRYIGSIVGVPPAGVSVESPVNPNPYLVAELVDTQGNTVNAGDSGYLRLRTLDPDYTVVVDDKITQEQGRPYDIPITEGSDRGFGHYFGLNNFFVETYSFGNTALNLSVRNDIQDNSALISTSALYQTSQPAAASEGPLYTYELGLGNSQIAQQLADLALNTVEFAQNNLLPTTTQTISGYAGTVLGVVSTNTIFAEEDLRNAQFILEGFKENDTAIRGVNIDEELANTIIYQNAYTAATRVITVTKELFQTLLEST